MVRLSESAVPALVLAAGIAIAGALLGSGFARGRASDRFVTVKGIAEQPARADLALWPLRITAADDDLTRAHQQIASSVEKVRAFLAEHGIDPKDAELQSFRVADAYTNQYRRAEEVAKRFVVEQTVMLRSDKPQVVLSASQQVGDLVRAGVVLSSRDEFQGGGPTFLFTRLNDLKPAMIAQATARAREAAEQFARDSKSELGGIRRAYQGVFEILPRDPAQGIQEESQIDKRIRVVSTVEYFLRD